MKPRSLPGALAALLSVLTLMAFEAPPAFAQLNGANILGDTGVDTGSQPAPGLWIGAMYFHYRTDTIRTADGTKLVFDPTQRAKLSIPGFAPTFQYVSKGTILGGHYGMLIAPSVTNAALEAPGFGLDLQTGAGMGDTYILPAQIGWHLPQADITSAFGIWAPTGRYTAGAIDNNTGRGMWTYEVSTGATLFLDPERSWSAATAAYYETHGKKEGTALDIRPGSPMAFGGVRVGNILSLEGGLAREFAHGAAHAGVAYYAQWKLTDDDFGFPVPAPGGGVLAKHRVYGVGPDVTLPIATKTALIAVVNVRYFWEMGAEVKTEGQSLFVTMGFPVPSLKVKP